jgi:hypothetical protein
MRRKRVEPEISKTMKRPSFPPALYCILLMLVPLAGRGADTDEPSAAELRTALNDHLHFQTGEVTLPGGLEPEPAGRLPLSAPSRCRLCADQAVGQSARPQDAWDDLPDRHEPGLQGFLGHHHYLFGRWLHQGFRR